MAKLPLYISIALGCAGIVLAWFKFRVKNLKAKNSVLEFQLRDLKAWNKKQIEDAKKYKATRVKSKKNLSKFDPNDPFSGLRK